MATTVYNTGTVAVANGATAVTGSGTTWLTSGIQAGDLFWANGLSVRIALVNSNTSITLASGWPGTTLSAGSGYEIRYIYDGERGLAATNALINTLSNGNNTAIAGLTTAADKLGYWTGAGAAGLVTFLAWARGFIGAADAAAGRTALAVASAAETVLLATNQTITGLKTISLNTATTFSGYLFCSPTDFAVGKPRLAITKQAAATGWEIGLWDGASTAGILNMVATTFSWNGSQLVDLATGQTITAQKIVTRGIATFFANYLVLSPSDTGTGKPQLLLQKSATATDWNFVTYDGTIAGTLNMQSSVFRANGAYGTTTANAANMNVASDGTIARSTSSEKYKTDIERMSDEYADVILQMEPIWYRSICGRDNPEHSFWGLSAEKVAELDPRLVHWKTHEMVTTVKDQEVEEQETYIAEMKTVTDKVPVIDEKTGKEKLTSVKREEPVFAQRTVKRIEQVPVTEAVPLDTPEPEGVAYERLTVHLISIAQRQQKQIEALSARLEALGV